MKRNLGQLSERKYDLIVVGGGIYGVCVAWDATLRGLSVALLERKDFGWATSANSLKVVHGGFRYLQKANVVRMRQSIRERMSLMRIAPHLVHPLPFVIPTYTGLLRSKILFAIALGLNDLISIDRNQLSDPEKHIPRGHIISKKECLQFIPGLESGKLTGGAMWYDCQLYNSFVRSAEGAGADVTNYVEVNGFLWDRRKVIGVKVKDVFTRQTLDIRAKIVVNATGPWMNRLLEYLPITDHKQSVKLLKAINIVTRSIPVKCAVGLVGKHKDANGDVRKNGRYFFITPWRDLSLIGTAYFPHNGCPDELHITEEEVESFINQINDAYPAARLRCEDVLFVHKGLVPGFGESLATRNEIYDHERESRIEGLVSVIGVKYTTARSVAEKVTDLVFAKLGKKPPRCKTDVTPIYGGNIESFSQFLSAGIDRTPVGLSPDMARKLLYNYGSEWHRVTRYFELDTVPVHRNGNLMAAITAEILHSVREEMAQKLGDVIFRRADLATLVNTNRMILESCASIMAVELGWDGEQTQRELNDVKAELSPFGDCKVNRQIGIQLT